MYLAPALEIQLLTIAELVNEHIQDTPGGKTNVTEWCKMELCWKKLQELPIPLNRDVEVGLLENDEIEAREKTAKKIQKIDNGIFAQKYVIEKGSEYWKQVAQYGLEGKFLSPREMSIMGIVCDIPNKIPSEKQSEIVVEIEEKLKSEGFFLEGL